MNYEEAFERLKNNTIDWKYALWNNKIYYESNLSKLISTDSIISLVKADTTYNTRKAEAFYRNLKFIHPKVIKQLFEIENSRMRVIKPFYYSDQLLKLLKHSDPDLNKFALNSYYYHNEFSETKSHKNKIIDLLSTGIRPTYKDSVEQLIAMINMTKYSEHGIFQFLKSDIKTNNIIEKSDKEKMYQFILSNVEHSSYHSLSVLLKRKDVIGEYKKSLINTFKHTSNDSLSYLLKSTDDMIIKLKLIQKINIYSNKTLLINLLDLFKTIETNQRILEEILLKWNRNEFKEVIREKLSKTDPENLIHIIFFIGKKKFKEFEPQIKKLTSHQNQLVQFEAIRTIKRLR